MNSIQVHRRQWIITKRANLPPGLPPFKVLPLPSGLYLHHEPNLTVTHLPGAIVLGDYLGSSRPTDDWHYLTGRFVVFAWPWLSLDATGSMSVLYCKAPGQVVCSSSTALISEVTGNPIEGRVLRRGRGLEWDPLPASRIRGFRKMFCDQALNLETRTVHPRPRTLQPRSEAEAADALADHFADTMSLLSQRYGRIFLPMTGGRDSRVLLSALVATGIKFEAFTHVAWPEAKIDARVASRLCRRYGVPHDVVAPAGPNPAAVEAFDRHTGGSEVTVGPMLASGNIWRNFRPGDLVLDGMTFEVGRRFYARRFRTVDFSSSRSSAEGIARAFGEAPGGITAALRTWHRWRGAHPIVGLDYTDAFYLDQRISGFMAAVRQGRDAYLPDVFAPANSWNCIEMLMSATPARRSEGAVQMRAMERLLPGVSAVEPFNPRSPWWRLRSLLRSKILGTRLEPLARRIAQAAVNTEAAKSPSSARQTDSSSR